MEIFRQKDIMVEINKQIESDPLVKKIKLDEQESRDFLDEIPRLYNLGLMEFNDTIERREYIYKHVLIEVASNQLLCG